MNSNLKKELAITACKVRMGIIEGTHSAKSGHPGGSLLAADVLTYLYFCEMNVDPQHPDKADRDRLVLSKGHVAPALYAVLAHKGYFPVEELKTLRKIGSRLQGHPDMKKVPGVDMSSGSLGQGISAACGMAKAAKLPEQLTGASMPCWATARFRRARSGRPQCSLRTTIWTTCACWWTTTACRSTAPSPRSCPHTRSTKSLRLSASMSSTSTATTLTRSRPALRRRPATVKGQPTAIIAEDRQGQGRFLHGKSRLSWHGTAPNDEQYEVAMKELGEQLKELEC